MTRRHISSRGCTWANPKPQSGRHDIFRFERPDDEPGIIMGASILLVALALIVASVCGAAVVLEPERINIAGEE